ncbi:MAG: uracil phosphoribosyltransferase [Bacteroidales bacterium]|jgi:uracil phosphoribosyltransferase|nr:uracil phosphoribosyltransferase [Bacteroidales bacterium]MBR6279016.1 uracil phosphoribosyltransferase [Bacteroidales bacterium]
MKIHCLSKENSVAGNFIAQMRDVNIQKDSLRFRNNIKRLSHVLAYEISKTLNYNSVQVETPLGKADCNIIKGKTVIASVLRAGLPMHEGFIDIFDDAENAFLSEYRAYNPDGKTFEIKFEYMASPEIEGKTLIIVDPMLATGSSIIVAMNGLLKNGRPSHIHFASIFSSEQGIETLKNNIDSDLCDIWTVVTDPYLNSHGYIVPGLGDAGDLCYGEKL